jgi:hypothetical protein
MQVSLPAGTKYKKVIWGFMNGLLITLRQLAQVVLKLISILLADQSPQMTGIFRLFLIFLEEVKLTHFGITIADLGHQWLVIQ